MAGTWTHEEKRRRQVRKGWDVTVEFTRNITGEVHSSTFFFTSEASINASGPARLVQKKHNLEISWSDLNRFDMPGDDGLAREILLKLIKAIRNNNDLTAQQAITWYDNNYPDSLYNGVQLMNKMRNWLTKQYEATPTWAQFKTYIINHIFEGVD